MNPINSPIQTSAAATPPPIDARAEAVQIGASGDLDAASTFVRAHPEQRDTVEQAMRDAGDTGGIFGLAERLSQGAQSLIEAAQGLVGGIEAPPPVVGIDSPGWPTPLAAANDVLDSINPTSIAENREYGGYIFETAEGTYGWTIPAKGGPFGVDISRSELPPGVKIVGAYHTHGDYTEVGPGGTPRATTKDRDETNADQFSIADLLNAREGVQEYLGTPSGEYRWYNPSSGEVETF